MHGGTESGGGMTGGAGVMAGRRRSRSLSTLGLIAEKGFHSGNTGTATGPPDMAGLNGVAGTKLVDQRLDPSQLYLRYDPDTGSSRMSVRSLRDDADYSRRVLRLANPDD
ncbi:Cell wall integrity and stress response component 4 [Maublancomyces gigas]|uniref:Cell wall integrity and stress response component 4 n=1 Tax=Discina gigas TaxID=1032678 RepID=A0ABR3GYJ7_9PEZI